MSWLILALTVPVAVAWYNGSTYTYAFSIFVVGIVLYVANTMLIAAFIKRSAPQTLEDESWEETAGTGIVPKWVSVLGLIGIGFIPSGLIVALLLWLGVIISRAH